MAEDLLDAVVLGMLGKATPRRGPSAPPLHIEYVRDMTLEDVAALADPNRPTLPSLASPAQVMRHKHHLLARSIASGASDIQASAETGYAIGTIGTLKKSPAFTELVEYYKGNKEVRMLELAERRAIVGTMVLEEIEERLSDEEVRKRLTMKELRELVGTVIGEGSAVKPGPSAPGGFGGLPPGGALLNVTFTSAAPPIGVQASDGATTIELVANEKEASHG